MPDDKKPTFTVIEGGKVDEPDEAHAHDIEEMERVAAGVIDLVADYSDDTGICFNCTMNTLCLMWFGSLISAVKTMDPEDPEDAEAAERAFGMIHGITDSAKAWADKEIKRWE